MRKRIISMLISAAIFAAVMPISAYNEELSENVAGAAADATEYTGPTDDTFQYCVEGDSYFAYMWIPETAQHLNGMLVAKSNLIEARLMQSKTIRDTLSKYNIGMVYIHARNTTEDPNMNTIMGDFNYINGNDAGAKLDEMMARFAAVSGYDELRYTPFIGVGHSAGMGMGRALGSWDPSRVIAQICLKGGASLTIPGVTGTGYSGDSYEVQPGVPIYLETGQFTEHASYDNPAGKDNYIDNDLPNITKIRAKGTDRLVTMSVEWESGHYDWSESSNKMLAEYLDAIIPLRLGSQADTETKMTENYTLCDLAGTGYVSDVKMYGTRTSVYAESEYSHGAVSDFSENEQKSMVWFPNKHLYASIRDFTSDRKDIASTVDNNSYVTYDRSYTNSDGEFSCYPANNICYYVSSTQSITMEFNITEEIKSADKVVFKAPFKSGNSSRNITVSQISNPWSDTRGFTVPSSETVIVQNVSAGTVEADVTEAVKTVTDSDGDKLYIKMSSSDEGSGSDFYCTTKYAGYDCGSLTEENTNLPRLEPEGGAVDTKHQYLLLEDPSSKTPKSFTRITRYDAVNPNDSLYADGLDDDPMTFSMYVDKLNVVSPDHIGAGSKVAKTSSTPAVVNPVMAPVEWVSVEQVALDDTDAENNVSSKWKNILRWKNNRVFYRMTSQDSYMNINTYDVYDDSTGELEFSYATNTFQIYPLFVSGGQEQHITMDKIADVDKSFIAFTVNPESSANLPIDVMVEYGPVKAERQSDGSYKITPEQIPAGATYPIECKIVASQFGVNNNGTKINTAEPVERVFYITDNGEISALPLKGKINQNLLIAKNITGFNVEGSGTITLKMNSDTAFNAKRAADITSERTNTSDSNYAKHYKYPENYNPYDYWNDYPGEWTVRVSNSGFVPLSAFTNGDRTNINLRYLNTIASSGITSITPVVNQTEVTNAKVNSWGNGVNIVWQKPQGNAYDSVKVYIKDGESYKLAENAVYGSTNALVTGLDEETYTFKITTVKDNAESDGVIISGTTEYSRYILDDFETGDLTSGMNWLVGQEASSAYAWSTHTGASVLLMTDEAKNHYMGIQNTYTSAIQTMNINIPGGITADMTSLTLDIKVDKLENSQPSGQVYFELFNPTTGKSYGVEKGSDFDLDDKEWHNEYSVPLSSFGLPKSEEELQQITVLKIGRKAVSGGNNNRRAKIYLDNLSFTAEEPVKTLKLPLSADYVMENNSSLPNGFAPDRTQVNYLFDSDTSNTNLYAPPKQQRLYLDLGKEYQIAKIVVTDYTTNGTFVVTGSLTDPSTISTHDETFKTMIRTNGSTQNGVPSAYEDITGDNDTVIGRTAEANDIYMVSGFEKVRYISLCDWSNKPCIAEIEIYVVDEGSSEHEEGSIQFGEPQAIGTGIRMPVTVSGNIEADAVIYVAEYDSSGRLSALRTIVKKRINISEDIDIDCTYDDLSKIKIFIWDNVQRPLSEPKTPMV